MWIFRMALKPSVVVLWKVRHRYEFGATHGGFAMQVYFRRISEVTFDSVSSVLLYEFAISTS